MDLVIECRASYWKPGVIAPAAVKSGYVQLALRCYQLSLGA